MKKSNKACPDFFPVFNKQRKERTKQSTEERLKKLETTLFFLFGLLFGMILTHIVIHSL